MKVTRKIVAERAGVSPQTVSYYLNGSRKLSEGIQAKIAAAVAELGYVPDMIATSLVKNQTRTIGVIMNDITNPLDSEIIKNLQAAALKKKYFIDIFGFGDVEVKEYIANIVARRVDGIYITAIPTKFGLEELHKLKSGGIRILASVNRIWNEPEIGHIDPDFMQGMDDIVRCLAGLGHRRIAYLSAFDAAAAFDNRLEAYGAALLKNGLQPDPRLLIAGVYPYRSSYDAGLLAARRLLNSGVPFTAAVATNDLMAFAAMRVFREAGLSVPEDVSVVGIDDTYLAEGLGLTSLGYDKEKFAEKAFSMLLDGINRNAAEEYEMKMNLHVRNTTACAKGV